MDWSLSGLLISGAWAWLLIIAVPLIWIDLREHRLPNRWTGLGFLISALLISGAFVVARDWDALKVSWTLAAINGALYLLLFMLSRGGVGMGDVKLAPTLGLFLGSQGAETYLLATLSTFIFGGLIAVIGIATGRLSMKSRIAFGPMMLVGVAAGVVMTSVG